MLPLAPWLCWGLPIIGALLTPLFARIHAKLRDYAPPLLGFLAMIFSFSMISDIMTGSAFNGHVWAEVTFTWLSLPGLPPLEFGMLIDPLSVFMACVSSSISFLILVFSLGYMAEDTSMTRYWFFMQFFVGGMLLLVMANNLLQTFIGWEIVGLCSYALIGFWYNRQNMIEDWQLGKIPEGSYNSHCGMKAFIVTRIGDIGLLVSILFIYFFTFGTPIGPTFNYQLLQSNYQWLANMAGVFNGSLMLVIFFLFFLGPIGKSAQFPLHIWLPEAMAGPTTVSALIHAAAMVKAGVYLVARMLPILVQGYFVAASVVVQLVLPDFFLIITGIGTFTAFMAASMAVVARELKKVLAFSTISQLGYMFMGLGVFALTADGFEGYFAATFHLASHAIFKALLFLCAGAVLHAVHSKDMFDMGGLRRKMPITFLCMLFGALSLSGVPPFMGFWSKESIFAAAWQLGASNILGYVVLAMAAITGALTFFYSLRMIGITFLGSPSQHIATLEKEGHHVHEAPKVMWVPLAILTVATLVLGFIEPFLQIFFFSEWPTVYGSVPGMAVLGTIPELYVEFFAQTFTSPTFFITLLVLLVGGVPGYLFYIRRSSNPTSFIGTRGFRHGLHSFLYNRWYYDKAVYAVFVSGALRFFDGMYKYIEAGGIDRFNYVLADGATDLSRGFRRIQTGVHSWNMVLLLLGAVVLLLLLVVLYLTGGGPLAILFPRP
jgi:NADH-quinone oxidoreductase subunit L